METQAQQKVVELPDDWGTVTLKREGSPEAVVDLNYGTVVEFQDLNIQLPKWRIRLAGVIFRDGDPETTNVFLVVIGEGTGLPEEFVRVSEVPDYAKEYFEMMRWHASQMTLAENDSENDNTIQRTNRAKMRFGEDSSSGFPVTVS